MTGLRWITFVLGIGLFASCAAGVPAGPAPRAGASVTTWLMDQGGSLPGKIVYMRNDT
jgi:hypothetical protein